MKTGKYGAGGGGRAALRCVCGHDIMCEVWSEGEYIGFLVFFDDEPASETYGQRVKGCPGCSEYLELRMLVLKHRPR